MVDVRERPFKTFKPFQWFKAFDESNAAA